MSATGKNDSEDKLLWQRFSENAAPQKTSEEVDPNLLAAYLDGTATEEQIKVIESRMSEDAELLETIAELRELNIAQTPAVSEIMVARIQTALHEEKKASARFVRASWWQTVAAAAAIILVSFCGYYLGESAPQEDAQVAVVMPSMVDSDLDEEGDDLFFDADDDSMEGLL